MLDHRNIYQTTDIKYVHRPNTEIMKPKEYKSFQNIQIMKKRSKGRRTPKTALMTTNHPTK